MVEDEHRIGSGYQLWLAPLLCAIPLATAYFASDLRWTVAVGAAVVIGQLHEVGGRLYDLCIRVRRTNAILTQLSTDTGEQLKKLSAEVFNLSYGFNADVRSKRRRDAEKNASDKEWDQVLTDLQRMADSQGQQGGNSAPQPL
jgi:hypothetical protein